MRIGILAVQGAFAEHQAILQKLGADCVELRNKNDLQGIEGLVLPGGESTVQGKLLRELDMFDQLQAKIRAGIPVLATCAGLILLSHEIVNDKNIYLDTLPVKVKRNAYGRQLGSFETTQNFSGIGPFDMIFIRAPYITEVSDNVDILSRVDGQITAVKYKNQIGLSFHPELGNDCRIHQQFMDMVHASALLSPSEASAV